MDAVIVDFFGREYLDVILELEEECFPPERRYPDAEEHYAKALADKDSANIFLLENSQVMGYMLAHFSEDDSKKESPKESSSDKEFSFGLENENNLICSVETLLIYPEFQGKGGSKRMMMRLRDEAFRRGCEKFALRPRMKNRFRENATELFQDGVLDASILDDWCYGYGKYSDDPSKK